MGALELIIVLTLVGFLMLAAEVFVPGMVLGLLGALALAGAVGASYYHYGLITGTFMLVVIGAVTMVGFIIWLKAFPYTGIGRRLMLQKSLDRGEGEKERPVARLFGMTGKALTPLRPSGTALINGRRVDVVAESELIETGADIVVIQEEGLRVVVRKSTGAIA